MHRFKSAILAIFQFFQNGTFEPVHEIRKNFWPKVFFWSIMKVPFRKNIHNMPQGRKNLKGFTKKWWIGSSSLFYSKWQLSSLFESCRHFLKQFVICKRDSSIIIKKWPPILLNKAEMSPRSGPSSLQSPFIAMELASTLDSSLKRTVQWDFWTQFLSDFQRFKLIMPFCFFWDPCHPGTG